MKIAVSGKGGTGKTVICSNLAKLYAKWGYKVYAIDADPDGNLGVSLGMSLDSAETLKPIFDMREYLDDKDGDGELYLVPSNSIMANSNSHENPNAYVDSAVADRFSCCINDINFFRMSSVKSGGSTCYCRENSFLKAVIKSLVLNDREVAVLDMCAGIEHLVRGVSQGIDTMLIVTDASRKSVETARTIEKLSLQLGIKNIRFIGNRIRSEKEEIYLKTCFSRNELIGVIHYSEKISNIAMGFTGYDANLDNSEIEIALDKIVAPFTNNE